MLVNIVSQNDVIKKYFQDLNFKVQNLTIKDLFKLNSVDFAVLTDENYQVAKSAIRAIRKINPNALVVYMYTDTLTSKNSISADDFYNISLHSDKNFALKIGIWQGIVKYRKTPNKDLNRGYNAFGAKVWSRITKIDIKDESSLELLWEYFLNDKRFDSYNKTSAWISACYESCLFTLKNDELPTVIFEENESSFFLTIARLPTDNISFYTNLITAYGAQRYAFIVCTYKQHKGVFSLYMRKHLTIEQELAKSEKQEPIKISANIGAANLKQNNALLDTILHRPTNSVKDSAKDYIIEIDFNPHDLVELDVLVFETDELLSNAVTIQEQLYIFGAFFASYARWVSRLIAFNDLRVGIEEIAKVISESNQQDELIREQALMFAKFIKSDLELWVKHIFVLQDADNIHYLDASMLANCLQFKNLLSESANCVQGGLEIF